MLRVAALIATLAVLLLGGVGPVAAHPRSLESFVVAPSTAPAAPDLPNVVRVASASESTGTSWPFVMATVLAAATLARRRSRRLIACALLIFLVVFAVESAQHSVHHVLDKQPVACPTALVAADLNGATVEAFTLEVPILQVGAQLDAPDRGVVPLRSFDPQQERAPPSARV